MLTRVKIGHLDGVAIRITKDSVNIPSFGVSVLLQSSEEEAINQAIKLAEARLLKESQRVRVYKK